MPSGQKNKQMNYSIVIKALRAKIITPFFLQQNLWAKLITPIF